MALPNLSNSLYVAWLRYVQHSREERVSSNPDSLVKDFLPLSDRWRVRWLGNGHLTRLRSDPFYYYLIARTKHYDQVVQDAVADGVTKIIGIGCGSDTRPYRFQSLLRARRVSVVECDQADSIGVKQRIARRWRCSDFVKYMSIDLNDSAWPALQAHLGGREGPKTLLMMEGVSPYVDRENFQSFLRTISDGMSQGSHVAYDYKVQGVKEDFGREGRTRVPFRLSPVAAEVADFHQAYGLNLTHFESGPALTSRLLPSVVAPPFDEDCLVRLTVAAR